MHIVSVSSEMLPLAKSGGLGDVCGALPIALEKTGVKVSAFLPAYRSVMKSGLVIEPTNHTFTIHIAGRYMACRILRTKLPQSNVDVYLIDQPHYFDRDGLYADRHGEFRDNCERYSFFCRSVVQAIEQLQLDVDIVHCHDWQAGLVPAYIHARLNQFAWMERAKSVMTIHNLAYQGRFWNFDMPLTGLDWKYFNSDQMEYYGDLNLMKTGIVFADAVTTVSPTYAREITRPEHGCGLDGILRGRGSDLVGIVNGVDYTQWNPATDEYLPQKYNADNWQQAKAVCKAELQAELGLEIAPEKPLIGIVSRLASQKGWDLIIPLLLHWVSSREVQWAILGTGDSQTERELRELANHHPHRISANLAFSEAVAHRIEAASDIFLMPSRYEPCGLNQLYSLKYGTIPLVHSTGGLTDTVTDASDENLSAGTATGFRFDDYSLIGLERALNRALDFYLHRKPDWCSLVMNGMQDDWSWKQSAEQYVGAYQRLLVKE